MQRVTQHKTLHSDTELSWPAAQWNILEHLCSAVPLYEPQNPHNTEHTDNLSLEYFVKVNVALNPYI